MPRTPRPLPFCTDSDMVVFYVDAALSTDALVARFSVHKRRVLEILREAGVLRGEGRPASSTKQNQKAAVKDAVSTKDLRAVMDFVRCVDGEAVLMRSRGFHRIRVRFCTVSLIRRFMGQLFIEKDEDTSSLHYSMTHRWRIDVQVVEHPGENGAEWAEASATLSIPAADIALIADLLSKSP